MRRSWALQCCLLVSLVAIPAATLRADGLMRDGLGAIPMGRGGTNLGFYDNASIINDNAAAMVNVGGRGLFDASADTLITDIHYSDPQNTDILAKVRPMVAPNLGYIRKSADGDWAWGLGAFVPAGFGASYDMQSQFAGPQVYRTIGGVGKILPALSYRVTDRLSVGGTLGIAISDVQLNAPYVGQSGPLAGVPTIFGMHTWGVAPTGSFGFQYKLTPDTVLGFNWQSKISVDQRGEATTNIFLPPPFPSPIYSHYDAKVHVTWPSNVAFGVRHNLCPHRIISAEVVWYDWSHAFTALPIQLSNPSNPIVGLLSPGPIHDSLPLHWLNSVSLRTGYQWQPNGRDIYRMGYVYHASPTPDSTLNPLVDGVLVHTWTVGYSRMMRRVQMNAGYQFSYAPTRYVGTSQIIGPGGAPGDFANSSFNAQIHYVSLGFLVPF